MDKIENEKRPQPSLQDNGMDTRNFAFGKTNYVILAIGMLVVILGFILMSGGGSDETHYDPSIFSPMRIKVAPAVCFIGFISMIFAILYKPKDKRDGQRQNEKEA